MDHLQVQRPSETWSLKFIEQCLCMARFNQMKSLTCIEIDLSMAGVLFCVVSPKLTPAFLRKKPSKLYVRKDGTRVVFRLPPLLESRGVARLFASFLECFWGRKDLQTIPLAPHLTQGRSGPDRRGPVARSIFPWSFPSAGRMSRWADLFDLELWNSLKASVVSLVSENQFVPRNHRTCK